MKSQLWIGTASLAVALALSACAPEEPIVGSWKVVSIESRVPGGSWAPDADSACNLDNTEEYSPDGDWTLYEGTVHCGSDPIGIMTGTWRMAAGGTKVLKTYDDYVGEYESTVEQLTDTQMVLSHAAGDTAGTQFRTTFEKVE